jgi:hypothetical protein
MQFLAAGALLSEPELRLPGAGEDLLEGLTLRVGTVGTSFTLIRDREVRVHSGTFRSGAHASIAYTPVRGRQISHPDSPPFNTASV